MPGRQDEGWSHRQSSVRKDGGNRRSRSHWKENSSLCKAFGCRVIGFNRSKITDPVIDEQVSLEELLKQSDIVSLHCPLTEDTKGMIGEEQLKMMKKTSLLINTARGA